MAAALFFLAGIAAICLLVGYRTRMAVVISWFLQLSLHVQRRRHVVGRFHDFTVHYALHVNAHATFLGQAMARAPGTEVNLFDPSAPPSVNKAESVSRSYVDENWAQAASPALSSSEMGAA